MPEKLPEMDDCTRCLPCVDTRCPTLCLHKADTLCRQSVADTKRQGHLVSTLFRHSWLLRWMQVFFASCFCLVSGTCFCSCFSLLQSVAVCCSLLESVAVISHSHQSVAVCSCAWYGVPTISSLLQVGKYLRLLLLAGGDGCIIEFLRPDSDQFCWASWTH